MRLTTQIKLLSVVIAFASAYIDTEAKTYYLDTHGDDASVGSREHPFATFGRAYTQLAPGDTLYMRGGVYKVHPEEVMDDTNPLYARVYNINKVGTADKPLLIAGYPGERVVFDLEKVRPDKRVTVFYVKGSYHHFRDFEVIHTQVTQHIHTQSECFRNEGGSHNLYENLKMHDGMGIGFYLTAGSYNTVLNCDAYHIDDTVSEGGRNENTDGFGCHPAHTTDVGNVLRGCRAWNCGDDGFDLINAQAPVVIDHCIAVGNGYRNNGTYTGGNGNGFKMGGYGMSVKAKVPTVIPRHTTMYCVAAGNRAAGFYANHHLGGLTLTNNTASENGWNYRMTNRQSVAETVDVPGYDHVLTGNVSVYPRVRGGDIVQIDASRCTLGNNTFLPAMRVSSADFSNLDPASLLKPREADGSLPHTDCLVPMAGSALHRRGMGYTGTRSPAPAQPVR